MQNIIRTTGHQLKFGNITGSDNCFLYDEDGNRRVDLESGVWCTSVGHNNRRVNQVITNQIGRITHTGFCYGHPAIDETALKVLEICGLKGGKCEFLCSGSEAVELGMRIARTISVKPLALTFADSYFGAYGDAASKYKSGWHIYDRLNCGCSSSPEGCTGECEEFQKIPFSQIGIFLFEPGSSMGLVRFASEKLIRKITNRIRTDGGIVMAIEFHKDANLVYEMLLDEGYIVCKRPNAEVLRLDPALTVEMETLEMFMDALNVVLNET
jgi:acetylornithine/N-succinyldiaminopimelate aminotransferase